MATPKIKYQRKRTSCWRSELYRFLARRRVQRNEKTVVQCSHDRVWKRKCSRTPNTFGRTGDEYEQLTPATL